MKLGPFALTFTPRNSPSQPSRRARRSRVSEFGGQTAAIEYLSDLIIQLETLQGQSHNRYLTRRDQVQESWRKYRGQAAKGNLLVRNILETRAAFTVGKGVGITGWEVGSPERQFVEAFFRTNKLNLAYLRKLGRERCFEGQVLLALLPGIDGVPLVRFVSWLDTGYEVVTNPFDYAQIQRIHWEGRRANDIPPGQASFMKFHTRLNAMEGTPLFAGVLNICEDLDDALGLLKTINAKAANPTPYFKFAMEDDAAAFQTRLTDTKWKMGDALAGSGDGSMIQLGYGPYSAIEAQIATLVKVMSGHTSVPPHYFGFSELLNNRSVADDIRLMYVRIADSELDEWGQGITDLVGRAMAMYNAVRGDQLNHQAGNIQIEQISEEQFLQVMQVWLPVWLGGGIDTETLLSKLPGIDEKTVLTKVLAELATRHGQTPGQLLPEERKAAEQNFRAYSQRA